MPLVLKLALRSISLKRGGLARFTSLAAALMVSIAVFVFLFTYTLARAFETTLISSLTRSEPHVVIVPVGTLSKDSFGGIFDRVAGIDCLTSIRPAASTHAMVSANGRSNIVLIRTAESESSGLMIGDLLAARLEVGPGDEVELVVQARDESLRKVRTHVGRVSSSGLADQDLSVVSVGQSEFAAIVGDEVFTPDHIEVFLADPMTADDVAARIAALAGDGVQVVPWQRSNRVLFESLRTAKSFAAVVVLMFAAFGMFGLAITTAVLVRERKADIAIFRTLGMPQRSIALAVAIHTAMIALAGGLLGVALFYLTLSTIDASFFLALLGTGTPLRTVSVVPGVLEPALALAAAVALAIVSGLIPALSAARIKPLANLRHT